MDTDPHQIALNESLGVALIRLDIAESRAQSGLYIAQGIPAAIAQFVALKLSVIAREVR